MSLLVLLGLSGCWQRAPQPAPSTPVAMVRSRPGTPTPAFAQPLMDQIPGAQWDAALERSTAVLVAHARDPGARIPPAAAMNARAEAGYPCPANFLRELTGQGAQPAALAEELAQVALQNHVAVDVAVSRRDFDNGTTLWIAGICPSIALLDPMPRDLALGDPIPSSVELLEDGWTLSLYVDPPDRRIEQRPMEPTVAQWFTATNLPGTYRFEVVGTRGKDSRVLLLWSVFVDAEPAEMDSLPRASTQAQDPIAASQALFEALNQMRGEAGLPPVQRFERFDPLAREQAATLAWRGQIAHALPGVPTLADRAEAGFRPRARIYENLAAAPTWQEAHDLVALSPGHAQNLLCAECTHASIGVALEPTVDRVPRLFVVWELMAFPDGEPQPLGAPYPGELR